MKTQTKTTTVFQSEELKIGQRGPYIGGEKFTARCRALGIETWVEKRRKTPDEFEKNLRTFINLDFGYQHVYGITYKGKDFDCGDMPRDLGRVLMGIEIALE